MPPRPAIDQLPQSVRDELSARLLKNGFSGYVGLSHWLADQGYQISKSAVHTWGANLESKFAGAMADARRAAELGRALAGEDDGSGLRRATTAMAQETLLRVLMGLRQVEESISLANEEGESPDPGDLARNLSLVTRSLADLGRLSIADANHTAKVKAQLAAELEQRVTAHGGGAISPEQLRAMLREAYGV